MAIKQLRLACGVDAWLRESNLGAGKSHELPIGLSGGNVHRAVLKFKPIDWAGERVRRVISAEIVVRNTGEVHVSRGASPRVKTWRILESWSEGTSVGLSSSNAVRWNNQPTHTVTGAGDSGTLPTSSGSFAHFPCTDIVKAWAPSTVEDGGGKANHGIMLASFDEGATSRTTEVYSREAGTTGDLVLVITVETNVAPDVPINIAPTGGAIAPITGAGSAAVLTFTGERVDPDVGDYITAVELAGHADGATDGAPGSAIASAITVITGSPPTFSAPLTAVPFTIGTLYRTRARTRDAGLLWSPWSSLADGQFLPDRVPGSPINLAVDAASLNPRFLGSLEALYAGQVLGAVRVVVYQDTTLGAVLKWDSGFDDTSGTRFDVDYGGTPLEVGSTYRWAAAVRDAFGAEGPLSAYQSWTVADVTGPSNMSPIDVETKQDSLTPTLTIGHSAAFDSYELEVSRFADGSGLLWDVGVTPVSSTNALDLDYAGTALTWGRTYYWRAKVRVGGTTWTDWSPWFPFYVNALPLAPVGSVDDAVDSGDHFTVTTSTAVLRFPFSDPDIAKGYAESATREDLEIRERVSGDPFAASPYEITSSVTDDFETDALDAETVYEARARYDDTSGQTSPWSAWMGVKSSTGPTIAEGTAIDEADPNPLVDWTFTSTPGKAQARYRVQVFADATGQLVHDSGLVSSATTSHEVPGDILEDATDYRYRVVAYDTDLLSDTLDGDVWTTDFDTPNPLTGLAAAGNADDSSVVLTWDATDLDPDYFWRYYIYRLDDLGTFVRIGEVDDIAVLTFTDLEASHGTSTYAVTVSNGWAESSQATVTATLALAWFVSDPNDASLRFALFNVTVYRAKSARQQEAFEPLGREFPLVVSGSVLAPAGVISVVLGPDEGAMLELIRRAARVSPYVVVKDEFGGVYRMSLGTVDQDRQGASMQTVSVDYRVVA